MLVAFLVLCSDDISALKGLIELKFLLAVFCATLYLTLHTNYNDCLLILLTITITISITATI